ncbi:MAG: helix-turn-helix domain-containing protein [Phycisphaera sp.]|nr:helix-turn-helix domain-containing protein [Phycisphaera sp.]
MLKSIGQIVRERREALGLTLSALAEEVGSTKSYLSMIENHRVANPPSRPLVAALERALRIKDGELSRAADWHLTPAKVKKEIARLSDRADAGRKLARWLADSAKRRGDGARSLDELFRTGELEDRIVAALGSDDPDTPTRPRNSLDAFVPVHIHVPLINNVAAGYPTGFTDLDYPAQVADEYVSCPDLGDPTAFAARVVGDSMMPDYREGDVVIFSPQAKVADGNDCFIRLEPHHETTFKRVYFEGGGLIRMQPLNPRFAPRTVERTDVAGLYRAVWRMQQLG